MPWSELLEWLAYLEIMDSEHEKLDYYLAQIAVEIHKSNQNIELADRQRVQIKDKLLKFQRPETAYEKMMRSKRTWAGMLGIEIPD